MNAITFRLVLAVLLFVGTNGYAQHELVLSGNGMTLPRLDRKTVDKPVQGQLIFDTIDNALFFYNGNDWISIEQSFPSLSDILLVNNDAQGLTITGLSQPTGDTDAATKAYVDKNANGGLI